MSDNALIPAEPNKPEPRLEDQLRGVMRRRQMSLRTEETYVQWYRRYVRHFNKRHPREMGAKEITNFLTFLAVEKQLGRSSQNQALNALVFFYQEVLQIPLDGIEAQRAPHRKRLPVVLTVAEVRLLMKALTGDAGLLLLDESQGSLSSQARRGNPGLLSLTPLAYRWGLLEWGARCFAFPDVAGACFPGRSRKVEH